ncbi:MAG: D-alanine--D-alanine ligase family protein [Bacteroidota bacterium]
MKKTIALLTGGTSPEHEVSLNSARNIYKAINKRKYRVEVIGIARTGAWRHLPVDIFKKITSVEGKEGRALILNPGQEHVIAYKSGKGKFPRVDAVFNIIHGPFGEDGTLQGLLSILDLPYVGPDTLGASVGMDKDFTKRILRDAGILVAPWVTVFQHEKIHFKKIIRQLGFPMFVKPANMGSSVGVSKAGNEKELKAALEEAFKFDVKVLVEQGLDGREIETAVLGNLEEIQVSGIGEIVMESGFYDYESKYLSADAARVVIPAAKVSKTAVKKIRETALKAYRALGLEGLARMDVFLVNGKEVYVNEPNTLPGFTNISMYPKLWEAAGLTYADLIDRLLQLAMQRHQRGQGLQRTRG